MIETDKKTKTQKQAEFMQKHTLTREDTEKLIRDKLERARAYSEAWRKREALLVEHRCPRSVTGGNEDLALHLKHGANGRPVG